MAPTASRQAAWTDGSFRRSAGYGRVITNDDQGSSPSIAHGSSCLGLRQAVFDATAIKAALQWHLQGSHKHMVIHSDPTSAIARSNHSGAGLGQKIARDIQRIMIALSKESCAAQILWVKGHTGVPGNEKADALAGQATEKTGSSPVVFLTALKLKEALDGVPDDLQQKRKDTPTPGRSRAYRMASRELPRKYDQVTGGQRFT
jgi:ribonuclease HI